MINKSESFDQAVDNYEDEDTIFDRKRKRSIKVKREEVNGILEIYENEDIS